MKIYISGKITGLEPEDAFNNFEQASTEVCHEYEPIHTMQKYRNIPGWGWKEYMVVSIELLLSCHAIYMLTNWKDSKGARIEHSIATEMGMVIEYQSFVDKGCGV